MVRHVHHWGALTLRRAVFKLAFTEQPQGLAGHVLQPVPLLPSCYPLLFWSTLPIVLCRVPVSVSYSSLIGEGRDFKHTEPGLEFGIGNGSI